MSARVVLVLLALTLALPAIAQVNFGLGSDLSLEIAPEHPAPGNIVQISAHSSLLDLTGTTLTWYENGKQIGSGAGLATVEITAGPLGSDTTVRVVAESDGELSQAEARIRPVEIDLLWESDSYIPPFFRGRALPSAGTNLRLEAIPYFKKSDGSSVPVGDITFTWKRNGYVEQSVSGRGKSEISLSAPALFGTDTISVEGRAKDGLEGSASVRIPSREPVVELYEAHPLFGTLYHRALGRTTNIPETESSFAAIPYYADATSPGDASLTYEWRVNGNTIASDPERPSELTINAAGSAGVARIELALSHVTNFFLSASGVWNVLFLRDGARNPFGTQ
ncbi:hypothetical protein HY478_03985 [Candidatus Uhrbacteria bacterium]|nr:hypothetical protein [Candidatus Uhrbacteria bacterium]